MKVEMVLPALYKAGMEVMTARLARGLAKRGHDVGFTCIEPGDAFEDELRGEGYRVSVVAAPGLRSIVRAPALNAWFSALRPDVAHVHSGAWVKGARAARGASVDRVVHTEHGIFERESWYHPTLKRYAAHFTDHVVAVAEPIRDYLTGLAKVDPGKVRLILNGVDTQHFRPSRPRGTLRSRLGLDPERLIVGNVARLTPIKNHALLIDAFALTRKTLADVDPVLVIAGAGAMRDELEARVSGVGLRSCVHFLGDVVDVAALYREFDLFVLSSTIEGTSMSILEAMASGVCVVSTAVGGNPGLLDDGRCGVLVPAANAGALAMAMADLLRNKDQRERIAATARERVATHYSEDAMIDAYEQLYQAPNARRCAA